MNKIDVKKTLITIALVLLAAGVTGGGVYYVLNQNFQKEREANEKALNEVKTQLNSTEVTVDSTTQKLFAVEEIKKFCTSGSSEVEVGKYTFIRNSDGDYVNCSIGNKGQSGSGRLVLGKIIDNSWKQIYVGQQYPSVEVANQYKIPRNLMFGANLENGLYPGFEKYIY